MLEALQQEIKSIFTIAFLRDISMILLGCFIVAVGFSYFVNPYHIVPGGVFGSSIVLHSFFPNTQIGTIAIFLQVPLLICSVLFLGTRIGLRTLIATFSTPVMINILSAAAYPTPEALHALDPSQLFGDHMDLSNDMILTSIIGAGLVGFGTAMVIRNHASSGGTDILAMLVHKYGHIHFSKALIFIDGAIVLAGLLVIGLGMGLENGAEESWTVSLYSLITMILMNRAMAWGISGNRDSKIIYIICEKEAKVNLREWILHTLDRTATHFTAKGLYSETDKEMIIMVVREKEVSIITDQIRQIAPDSFVMVTDSYDVYGMRWKELPENNGLDFK